MQSKLPILFVGAPGVGKTAKIKEQFDYVEVLLLSSATEEDIAGIPYHKDGIEYRTRPIWVERIIEADAKGLTTCLFFDELDKARREVADTMLTLVVSPEQFNIPKNTYLRAAANPPEWDGGDGISAPMLSRWVVMEFDMNERRVNEQLEFWSNRFDGTPAEACIPRLLDIITNNGWVYAGGEGLNKRIANPRTMTMALDAVLREEDGLEDIINGLLPPVFATCFVVNERVRTTVNRAEKHIRSLYPNQKNHSPLRL